MYQASNAFHQAVADGKPQMALLIFPDALFTNEDIDVDKGIEFNDYFNMEENISIGQALSNELSFSLFNDERFLNNYEFGEFKATLGVMISDESVVVSGNCIIQDGSDLFVGRDTSPYLRKNGQAMQNAPSWPVKSLLMIGSDLYCFGENGNTRVIDKKTGDLITSPVNDFMKNKIRRDFWNCGVRYDDDERSMMICVGGRMLTYEFVPLGKFIADRPNAPDNIEIDFHCNDTMMKFKDDMPDAETLGITYPITFKNLLIAMCNYVHVPYGGGDFINCDATLEKKPEEFDNCTMRDVVGWIAEAACANARINRDGYLILDWLRNTSQAYSEHDYMDFQPYWYETQTIDKLYNRSTQSGTDTTAGSGNVGYLIQDNPLLKGVS